MSIQVFASGRNFGALAAGANTQRFKAIYTGATGGDVIVTHKSGGAAITFASVPAGIILPVEGSAVTTPAGITDMVWMDW